MAEKSIYRDEYRVVLASLRTLREALAEREGGMTQSEFAERIGRTQGAVSAFERGVVRQDALQTMEWIYTCGSTMEEWGRMMDETIGPHIRQKLQLEHPKKASAKTAAKPKPKAKPRTGAKRSGG